MTSRLNLPPRMLQGSTVIMLLWSWFNARPWRRVVLRLVSPILWVLFVALLVIAAVYALCSIAIDTFRGKPL